MMRSRLEIFQTAVLQAGILVAMMAMLSACITSTESVYTSDISAEDAMNKRLELARRYIGAGDWENAERNLQQAAAVKPNSPQVHEAFALVYQSTGEYELAEENFKRAISIKPDFSRARNNYAVFLYQMERYKEAEKQLEVVVKDTTYKGRPRAFINLGLCRMKLKDYEGAKIPFERALAMERTNSIPMIELASIAYEEQNYAEAQQYYDRYRTVVRRPSAQALWLALRVAHARGDIDGEASHSLALRNMYSNSEEYKTYLEAKKRGDF
jgi:type IV pilus assembly protein PilF